MKGELVVQQQAIIDLDSGSAQLFLNFSIVRNLNGIKNFAKNREVFMTEKNTKKNLNAFLDQIQRFEDANKRVYQNSTYRARYGAFITFLYPQNTDATTRKKILKNFIRLFVQKEKLPYVAFERHLGKGTYAHVYFYDREYVDEYLPKVYKRTLYVNPTTGKWCGEKCKGAKLVCAAGEYQRDGNGRIKYHAPTFSALKSRLFTYVSSFEKYIAQLKQLLLHAISEVNVTYKRGKYFKKVRSKPEYNYFTKRAIAETNRIKCLMEHQISDAMQEHFYYPDNFMINRGGYDPGELLLTKKGKKIEQLYYHYRARFKKMKFTFESRIYKIAYTKLDVIRSNLALMYSLFKRELQEIVQRKECEG